MASTNALNIVDYGLRARMLGDAIPAESFATGANETGGLAGNYNVHAAMADDWPKSDDNDNVIWEHSDVKNVAYYYLYQFFEKVLRETR